MYVCLPECMYLHHMHVGFYGGQKRLSGLSALELQAVVSNPIWVQQVLLIAETCLQPQMAAFIQWLIFYKTQGMPAGEETKYTIAAQ